MHGYTNDANTQQLYSEMDITADEFGFIVVYHDGINSSWNVGTDWENNDNDDIGFINALIDAMPEQFNIDLDRVYACGMSNGGYMVYELACHLSHRIAAFGSVTGNFMLNIGEECNPGREIPFIDIRGTSDPVVPYYGTMDESMPILESIIYWSDFNGLTWDC